jgi:hypothetical protein
VCTLRFKATLSTESNLCVLVTPLKLVINIQHVMWELVQDFVALCVFIFKLYLYKYPKQTMFCKHDSN